MHQVKLTPRERDVLSLLVRGHSDVEVAELLTITVGTARNYVSTLYQIFGVGPRRVKVALLALHYGLVDNPVPQWLADQEGQFKYLYFVTYHYHKGRETGFGAGTLTLLTRVESMDQVHMIYNGLRAEYRFNKVVLTSSPKFLRLVGIRK